MNKDGLVFEYILFWEKRHPEEVAKLTESLENSTDHYLEFIKLLEEAILTWHQEKILWLTVRYGVKNDCAFLFEWINHNILNGSLEKYDIAAQSQENLLRLLIEKKILTEDKIRNQIKILKRREIRDPSFKKVRELMEFHLKEMNGIHDKKKEKSLKSQGNKRKEIPNSLKDIWLPGSGNSRDYYGKVIEYLKRDYPEIGKPFVTERNGKLYWMSGYGRVQYLKGLIYVMLKKKWIEEKSAPEYKRILEKTFNIDFNPEPFKSLIANPPNSEYQVPFKDIDTHIKK